MWQDTADERKKSLDYNRKDQIEKLNEIIRRKMVEGSTSCSIRLPKNSNPALLGQLSEHFEKASLEVLVYDAENILSLDWRTHL